MFITLASLPPKHINPQIDTTSGVLLRKEVVIKNGRYLLQMVFIMLADEKSFSTCNLILVDPRELLREGLSRLICGLTDTQITVQASDGSTCLQLAESLHPDVVVCSAQLPDMTGIDLAFRLFEMATPPRMVLVGSQESYDWVTQAVQAGVSGLVMQRDHSAELLAAIRAAQEGRMYLSRIASALFSTRGGSLAQQQLTPRQREILQQYAMGRSTKQIAYGLGLSSKTVATHREQILRRLGLRGTSDLIRYAIREGLVDI